MITINWTALWYLFPFGVFVLFLWSWRRSFPTPRLYFSHLEDMAVEKKGWREVYSTLPQAMAYAALIFFVIAFIDLHYYVPKAFEAPLEEERIPTEGIAIYLVLDKSGSMAQKVGRMSKLDLMKHVTQEFVEGRPSDLIGLVSFARGAQILSPLTLDHKAVIEQLDTVDFVKEREQDGTAIGYALYKTASLIGATRHFAEKLIEKGEPAYEIKSSVVVLVTDGFQDPNPLDQGKRLRNIRLEEAAQYAKTNDVKLYVINVEPKLATQKFAAHRRLMQRIAEMTDGKFYIVDGGYGLEQIFNDIDRLEKSFLPAALPPKAQLPHLYQRVSFYPYLVGLGMVCLLISVFLRTTLMREVP